MLVSPQDPADRDELGELFAAPSPQHLHTSSLQDTRSGDRGSFTEHPGAFYKCRIWLTKLINGIKMMIKTK